MVRVLDIQNDNKLILAGGTSIDREYFKSCARKFPNDFHKLPSSVCSAGSKSMVEFEEWKCRFEGTHAEGQEEEVFIGPVLMQHLNLDDEEVQKWYDADNRAIRVTR